MRKIIIINSPRVIFGNLNGSEVFVKLRIQRRQLIDGAVESAVVVTQDLTEEEGGERDVHNNALKSQRHKVFDFNSVQHESDQ